MSWLSGIGGAVQSFAKDAVGSVVESVASAVGGAEAGKLARSAVNTCLDVVDKGAKWVNNCAEAVCDALLPKELEFVGDIVSGCLHAVSGNWPAVIDDGLDLLKELPGQLKALADKHASPPPATPPPPPPPADYVTRSAGGETSSGAVKAASNTGASSGGAKTDAAQSTGQAGGAKTDATQSTGQTGETKKTDDSKETKGQEAAAAFLRDYGNSEDFMEQIRNGNIPEDILNSQAGMMMIQERLHQIQQMNQLMTQMLKALHDMEMAIIHNVRV